MLSSNDTGDYLGKPPSNSAALQKFGCPSSFQSRCKATAQRGVVQGDEWKKAIFGMQSGSACKGDFFIIRYHCKSGIVGLK